MEETVKFLELRLLGSNRSRTFICDNGVMKQQSCIMEEWQRKALQRLMSFYKRIKIKNLLLQNSLSSILLEMRITHLLIFTSKKEKQSDTYKQITMLLNRYDLSLKAFIIKPSKKKFISKCSIQILLGCGIGCAPLSMKSDNDKMLLRFIKNFE